MLAHALLYHVAINNQTLLTWPYLLPLQARLSAELEALHRSLEQRERAVKELHTRIHQLEEVEVALNHTNATLALKVRCASVALWLCECYSIPVFRNRSLPA
jgi:hypothetical protein